MTVWSSRPARRNGARVSSNLNRRALQLGAKGLVGKLWSIASRWPIVRTFEKDDGHAQHPGLEADAEPVASDGLLTVSSVEKSFSKRPVVRGVSLSLARGEAVGLLGPNGAGKTTVFYMITGLIPADAGRIVVDGQDVTRLPMYRRARLGIGYLPQEASIFRGLTVEENIRAVLELVEADKKEREARLNSLLEEFGIARLRKSPSIALSGGERRRVEIARALASQPAYILLDEPFAGIDPIAIGDIRSLVRHLTERGIGVLITDHNVRETLDLIDRAYIIYDGQVLTEGTPDQIIANKEVRRVYLGDEFRI
jgi:lipopolysaccharide export system ATP-binding protein